MDLSIVIPARNVAATLRQQLDALAPQTWDGEWEIVVVDNGSTDATRDIVHEYEQRSTRVRLVVDDHGHGVSYVRNRGIEAARSDAVAICDGDDVVGPRWVAAMGSALREHRCVTGPVDVDRLNPTWLAETRGRFPPDRPREYYGAFPLIVGGNVGLRREAWKLAGGFDESFIGPEDAEFSLRLRQCGIAVHFAPDALLYYRYRAQPRALWRQGRYYAQGRPLLARRMHEAGVATPPRLAGWKTWLSLVRWLPRLRSPEGRAAYAWIAGNRVGQLEGAVRHRALYL